MINAPALNPSAPHAAAFRAMALAAALRADSSLPVRRRADYQAATTAKE